MQIQLCNMWGLWYKVRFFAYPVACYLDTHMYSEHIWIDLIVFELISIFHYEEAAHSKKARIVYIAIENCTIFFNLFL